MNLIFEQTKNRRQCGIEMMVDGCRIQCTFSSSTMVTIPTGLNYLDGKLNLNPNLPGKTVAICKNHEMQLNSAFRDISGKTS